MARTATGTPKHLLKDGTPAEIREAVVPEDRERFDAGSGRPWTPQPRL